MTTNAPPVPLSADNDDSNNSVTSQEPVEPTRYDILCGKGRLCMEHEGNIRFHQVVRNFVPVYIQSKKGQKSLIVRMILEEVTGYYGGRFLKKVVSADGKQSFWYDAGKRAAREKVGHALRDAVAAAAKRKQAKIPDSTASQTLTQDLPKPDVAAIFGALKEERLRPIAPAVPIVIHPVEQPKPPSDLQLEEPTTLLPTRLNALTQSSTALQTAASALAQAATTTSSSSSVPSSTRGNKGAEPPGIHIDESMEPVGGLDPEGAKDGEEGAKAKGRDPRGAVGALQALITAAKHVSKQV